VEDQAVGEMGREGMEGGAMAAVTTAEARTEGGKEVGLGREAVVTVTAAVGLGREAAVTVTVAVVLGMGAAAKEMVAEVTEVAKRAAAGTAMAVEEMARVVAARVAAVTGSEAVATEAPMAANAPPWPTRERVVQSRHPKEGLPIRSLPLPPRDTEHIRR